MSALYKDQSFTDNIIYYGDYTIRISSEQDQPMSVRAYKAFLLELDSYLDFIDTQVTAINLDVKEMRIFPAKQRINIGDSLYPVTISDN
jgi:hypothetical protein